MTENILTQEDSGVIVAQTEQGVRITVPLRFSIRARCIAFVLAIMGFVLITLPSDVLSGAQTLGKYGAMIFLVLGGLALLVGFLAIVAFLLVPAKGVVVDVTATELRAISWFLKRSWQREKIRSIAMRRLTIGFSVVTLQVGYDPPTLLTMPCTATDARQAAKELRAAIGLVEPPNEGKIMLFPGWN